MSTINKNRFVETVERVLALVNKVLAIEKRFIGRIWRSCSGRTLRSGHALSGPQRPAMTNLWNSLAAIGS